MRTLDFFEGALAKVAGIVAKLWRHSNFVCNDCERIDRCGLPPVTTASRRQRRPNGVGKARQPSVRP